jgi:hypothetical protein
MNFILNIYKYLQMSLSNIYVSCLEHMLKVSEYECKMEKNNPLRHHRIFCNENDRKRNTEKSDKDLEFYENRREKIKELLEIVNDWDCDNVLYD